jgi:phenylalanyl-tRNA synthetase alpha chain
MMIPRENAYSNIPPTLKQQIGKNLHLMPNHPLEIMKKEIYKYFDSLTGYKFQKFETLSPFVTVKQNFDDLLIPSTHPARKKTDTYYINENEVLRTHTTAHETELLSNGIETFLTVGDVYRKDEIDSCHNRVFHQMEGVGKTLDGTDARKELERILGGLVNHLFPGKEYRINPDYFPFTTESMEVEVNYNGKWLEILGGGVLEDKIVDSCGLNGKYWAFGLGLERLAMILFSIPDIRYFWTEHPKFMKQFESGKIVKFKPYSRLPNLANDISFFINDGYVQQVTNEKGENIERWIEDNDFFEIVREIGGNWVENVKTMDAFFHKKKNQHSRTFTITFSPNDPSLKDPTAFRDLVLNIQENIRNSVSKNLHVTLR